MDSITQPGKRIHYPALSNQERELEVKNERLQAYVSRLLKRNAALSRRVREMEGARR